MNTKSVRTLKMCNFIHISEILTLHSSLFAASELQKSVCYKITIFCSIFISMSGVVSSSLAAEDLIAADALSTIVVDLAHAAVHDQAETVSQVEPDAVPAAGAQEEELVTSVIVPVVPATGAQQEELVAVVPVAGEEVISSATVHESEHGHLESVSRATLEEIAHHDRLEDVDGVLVSVREEAVAVASAVPTTNSRAAHRRLSHVDEKIQSTSTVAARAAHVARASHGLKPSLERKAAIARALRVSRPPRPAAPTLRVLLIGNNYARTRNELGGCVNDVRTAETWLRAAATAASRAIVVTQLADERASGNSVVPGRDGRGTGANILAAINSLVSSARAGDALYVHYSGHGAGLATRASDEPSRINSTWVPLDFASWRGGGTAGMITDNELRVILVNRVPAGCALWVTSDSCFSGTALDLRFNYADASFRTLQEGATASARAPAPWTPTPPPNGGPALQFNTLDRATAVTMTENRAYTITAANVVLLSGCKDTQTSADTYEDRMAQGALTWALFNCIDAGGDARVPLKHLIKDTRGLLRSHSYTQIPQLSSGKSMDLATSTFADFLGL